MARTADYTIKGFLYQFLLTLQTLLEGEENIPITIEGVNEDIEAATPIGLKAIQCKYHESKSKFQLSDIYKPVLQMLVHYKKNPNAKISYILHCYFPNEDIGSSKSLTESEIKLILETQNKEYAQYIRELEGDIDLVSFVNKFQLKYGFSYEDTQIIVKELLAKEGFVKEDIEDLFLPNAIQSIAEISILHDDKIRTITKKTFLDNLKEKKSTAISRWTIELISKEKILKKRREQLKNTLGPNSRERCLLLDADYITDFENVIITFICDFLAKYNFKITLHNPPLFCIKTSSGTLIDNIWERLHKKNILVERGRIGSEININQLMREPQRKMKPKGWIEFNMRLCDCDKELPQIIPVASFDDLIVISDDIQLLDYNLNDCNIEILQISVINEIRYLLNLSNTL